MHMGDKYFLRSLFTLDTHQENPQEVGDPGLTMPGVGDRTGLHALGALGWGWGVRGVGRDLALGPPNPQGAKPVSKDSPATQYFICFITNWSYHLVCLIKTVAVNQYWISSVLSFSSL